MRSRKTYANRAGQSVDFDVAPSRQAVRYYLLAGTKIKVGRPGEALVDHEASSDHKLDASHGPFPAADGRVGFLIDGWVLLVYRSQLRQYGDT